MKHTCVNIVFFLSFLLLLLLFEGCGFDRQSNLSDDFNKIYTLKHKSYETELMISNGRIEVIDTFLIVVSSQRDSFCKVYSIPEEMKEVYSYGHIGNGAKEFLQPLLTYSYGDMFGLNDVNKNELSIMKLVKENEELSVIEQKRLKASYKMKKGGLTLRDYYFSRLDSSHYVSLLCDGDGRYFSLFDSTLTRIEWFGESPIVEELPNIALFNRLNGRIATYGGTMAFATYQLPYLACYQLKEEKMQKMWSFFYDKAFYEVRNGDLLFSKEKSLGQVLSLKMDAQYIYVLYLDQLLSEYDYYQTDKSCANKVLVFDYNGNPVMKFHLDCRVTDIAVSLDQMKLFGLSQLPDPTLVMFDIPQINSNN